MSVVTFGPKDEAAQKLGKEASDIFQAAFKKGPGRWASAMMEGLQALQAGNAFKTLMSEESDETVEATFDTKAAMAQIALGIAMDNAKDFSSLD